MAVKIKLKRMGKIRQPQYRIVVADARTKRDGRAIEQIGVYHPKEEPSLIRVDSARVQHWLGVGAQPTQSVLALLKVTGDWQTYRGEAGSEGTLRVKEARADKTVAFNAALAAAHNPTLAEATTVRKGRTTKPSSTQGAGTESSAQPESTPTAEA